MEKIKETSAETQTTIYLPNTIMSMSKLRGGPSSPSSSSFTLACAACKHQRKKCVTNCLLAPYFPQENQKQFLNAHRLFGVSNITKMLKEIEESQRPIAMSNLIYHANVRALDPVGGPYKIICDLKRKVECLESEIQLAYEQLNMYRSLSQQNQRQDRCFSYGELLKQEDEEYFNVNGYDLDHQSFQQNQEMMQNLSLSMEIKEQTGKGEA